MKKIGLGTSVGKHKFKRRVRYTDVFVMLLFSSQNSAPLVNKYYLNAAQSEIAMGLLQYPSQLCYEVVETYSRYTDRNCANVYRSMYTRLKRG